MTRRGFSLPELLIAIALAGTAGAFMIGTLVRQQRFYASASALLENRAQLRDAADVLATDIRGAAVGLLGIPLMRDSAIEMFTTIVASVVCSSPDAASISLPPSRLESGVTLTSMLAAPDDDDIALVFSFPPGRPDSGQWEVLPVSSFVSRSVASACPPASGFTSPGDASTGASAFVATLESEPMYPFSVGSPVHFVRRGRYSLYRSSDSRWYLGYRRCSADGTSACATIQPVSGPYENYSAIDGSGLGFRYLGSDGLEIANGGDSRLVARIDVVLRGRRAHSADLAGDSRQPYRDSVVVSVSPRNRLR